MQRVYSHQNPALVHHVKHLLEHEGIPATIRGEHLAAAVGGVAPLDAWVELWVTDEARLPEAMRIVASVVDEERAGDEAAEWTCPNCGETVEAPLAVCWNCGTERPG